MDEKEKTNISLFTGAGGLDLGLESVGFETIFATDIDEYSCITLKWGRQEAKARGFTYMDRASIWQRDIKTELDAKFVLRATRAEKGEIGLLSGGPPCQAFSVFGKRKGMDDERGTLAYEYLRLLDKLRPKAFVFENVYGLLSIEDGDVFEELKDRLSHPGRNLHYEVSVLRLDAANFGVPQHRDRIFIIGHKGGNKVEDREVRRITSGPDLFEDLPPQRTVRDAFRGLPEEGADYPPNHVGRNHSQRIIDRYSGLSHGERDSVTRINKLDPSRPSFTIIVGSDQGGGKGHIHPEEPREVTQRESARIQTFPDWWAFSGNTRHPIRQIGNAVPPVLGAAVGNEIRAQVFGYDRVPFLTILERLDQMHLVEGDEELFRKEHLDENWETIA
jgi:DNA (cytosine-5)-methyltransferase 1